MATHSSALAWRIPGMGEPRLCSEGAEAGDPGLGAGRALVCTAAPGKQATLWRRLPAGQTEAQARAQAAGSRWVALAWQARPEPLTEWHWTLRQCRSLAVQKGGGGRSEGTGAPELLAQDQGLAAEPTASPGVGQRRGHTAVSETFAHSALGSSGSRPPEELRERETGWSSSEVTQ